MGIWRYGEFSVNEHMGQMSTGAHGHRANGKKALGANEYRNKWGLGANWLLEKLIFGANGHLEKWAPGKMGIWGKGVGYSKCPVSISPNVCIWPPWPMSTWTFGGKGYLRCPNGIPLVTCAHFPQIFANGQWGKWAFEERGYPKWRKEFPKCSMLIHPKFLQMGRGKNWHLEFWGKEDLWGKGYPNYLNCAHFFQMDTRAKWALG